MDTYGVTVHLVADQALERVSVVFFPLGEFSRQSCHLSLGSNVKEADLKNLLLLLSSLCATWTCIFCGVWDDAFVLWRSSGIRRLGLVGV